jgi:replication factor C small subunit
MQSPLWIDRYAPAISDLPQADLRETLTQFRTEPMNLILHGPAGAGKTAAARALARAMHADPDTDLVTINVADFFDRSKKAIREDPRFANFLQGETEFSKQYRDSGQNNQYKSEWSKRDMLGHVLTELAGYQASSGEHKTLLLDNCEAIREDFQQALRRVMERHHETTQFVLTTRQPTKLLPPIRSRCVQVPVSAPSQRETTGVLESIATAEGATYERPALELLASDAGGNLRRAILDAQATHAARGEITREAVFETVRDVGVDSAVEAMLEAAAAGEFEDARSDLDDLLYDEELDGEDVLRAISEAMPLAGIDPAELTRLLGQIDRDLADGANDRVHLSRLLAALGTDTARAS